MTAQAAPIAAPASPISARWVGRALSGVAVLFLTLDGAIKLVPIQSVLDTLEQLGYQPSIALARGLGVLLLACTALYVHPWTRVIGAVLLTGYLGGAIATHLRVESPVFSHLLFGSYIGAMVWGGLLLRDARARALLLGR
jgi:hypothetical protein